MVVSFRFFLKFLFGADIPSLESVYFRPRMRAVVAVVVMVVVV
jgi:hypothetical protein